MGGGLELNFHSNIPDSLDIQMPGAGQSFHLNGKSFTSKVNTPMYIDRKGIRKIHKTAIRDKFSGKKASRAMYMLGQGFSHLVCVEGPYSSSLTSQFEFHGTNSESLITSELLFSLSGKCSAVTTLLHWKPFQFLFFTFNNCHIEL